MPRKHRAVLTGLRAKGFAEEESRKHIHFIYEDLQGRTTTTRTMVSHGAGGDDINDNLLAQMARQMKLKKAELLDLIDCPMSREDLEKRILAEEDNAES